MEGWFCNTYGPTKDSPDSFKEVFDKIPHFSPDFTLIAGDLNLALDSRLDRCSTVNNDRSAKWLNTQVQNAELVDVWRHMKLDQNGYTQCKMKPKPTFSILDYFLVSQPTLQFIKRIEQVCGFCTDQTIVSLEVIFNSQKRGPGHWKINNSLLHDKYYVDKINKLIEIELDK